MWNFKWYIINTNNTISMYNWLFQPVLSDAYMYQTEDYGYEWLYIAV